MVSVEEVNVGNWEQEVLESDILTIVDIFRGNIVDVSPKNYTIEVTGDRDKIDALLSLLTPFGIREIARTGKVAMSRGG